MRPVEIQELCEREFDFPIEDDALIDEFGERELTPPTGEPTTVAAVLDTANEQTYHSSEDIYLAVLGNLDESFVGRKSYDDRAGVWDIEQKDQTYSF